MAIANTVKEYLSSQHVNYTEIPHKYSDTAYNVASTAHVPGAQMAKAVMLMNQDGHPLMATVPANQNVSFDAIDKLMQGHYHLMSEPQIAQMFTDCKNGALPSLGDAYGIDMVIDDSLLNSQAVYLEAGDHETLIGIDHEEFTELMQCARHAVIVGSQVGRRNMNEHFYSVH